MKKIALSIILIAAFFLSACGGGQPDAVATASPAPKPSSPTPSPIPPTATPTELPATENEIARGAVDVNEDGVPDTYAVYAFNPFDLPGEIPTALGNIHVELVLPVEEGVDSEIAYLMLPLDRGLPETLYLNPRPASFGDDMFQILSATKFYFVDPLTGRGVTYVTKSQAILDFMDEGWLPQDLWAEGDWVLWSLWANHAVGDVEDPGLDIIFSEVTTFATWDGVHPIEPPEHASLPGQPGLLSLSAIRDMRGTLYLAVYTRQPVNLQALSALFLLGGFNAPEPGITPVSFAALFENGKITAGTASFAPDENGLFNPVPQFQGQPQTRNLWSADNQAGTYVDDFAGSPADFVAAAPEDYSDLITSEEDEAALENFRLIGQMINYLLATNPDWGVEEALAFIKGLCALDADSESFFVTLDIFDNWLNALGGLVQSVPAGK